LPGDDIAAWFNDVVSEGHKEIDLLGNLKQTQIKRRFNSTDLQMINCRVAKFRPKLRSAITLHFTSK
jgi:hypothetical protein